MILVEYLFFCLSWGITGIVSMNKGYQRYRLILAVHRVKASGVQAGRFRFHECYACMKEPKLVGNGMLSSSDTGRLAEL